MEIRSLTEIPARNNTSVRSGSYELTVKSSKLVVTADSVSKPGFVSRREIDKLPFSSVFFRPLIPRCVGHFQIWLLFILLILLVLCDYLLQCFRKKTSGVKNDVKFCFFFVSRKISSYVIFIE